MKQKLLLSLSKDQLRSVCKNLGIEKMEKANREKLILSLESKSYKQIVKAL